MGFSVADPDPHGEILRGMNDGRDAGHEECITGGMQGMRNAGQEGCST